MRRHRIFFLLPLLVLAACATPPRQPEFSSGYPMYDCPDHLSGQVNLYAQVQPIELSSSALHTTSIATTGSFGRRLLISVAPSGLRPEDRIVWSTLSIATYGGTLLGWDRLQTNAHLEAPSPGLNTAAARMKSNEVTSIALSPGPLKIGRAARDKSDLSGSHSIDLLVMPGGVAVDDAVVRIPALWHENGTAVAAEAIAPQLVPVRHPPGLDVVEATLELSFIVRVGKTGDEWSCSASSRVTLVDRDSLRPPFWDLGLAAANAARKEWLALFDPAIGAVRLVFDNPANAHALASWIRATGSTRLGPYALSVFQQSTQLASRPFGPISEDSLRTLRPMVAEDIRGITVGPAAEP